jgi:hypothetical protein
MGTNPKGDRLLTMLMLLADKEQRHLWEITRIYDKIDTVISSSGDHERISPLLAEKLSQLGTCNDMLEMIELHRPKICEESFEAINTRLQRWEPLLGGFQWSKPKGTKTKEWAE